MYGVGVKRFGTVEPRRKIPFVSRRQKEIKEVRKQLNQLNVPGLTPLTKQKRMDFLCCKMTIGKDSGL